MDNNMALKKSSFLQMINVGQETIVYHSLFGNPKIINKEGVELINFFREEQPIATLLNAKVFENPEENVKSLQESYFLIEHGIDERKLLKEKVDKYKKFITHGEYVEYLSLIVSELCNFACKYCISSSMINASYRRYNPVKFMDAEMAKKAVDGFLDILRKNGKNQAYINFGGGEPLLNWTTIQQILLHCKEKYAKEFQFSFTINTNISLINSEMVNAFKRYNVKVASSLDGLAKANNAVRVLKSGGGTFKKILKGINTFSDNGYPLTGFSITVTEDNFHLLDEKIMDFCLAKNFFDLRLDLDVIHMLAIPIETAVEKLISMRKLAKSTGISLTGFWERPAENLNNSILEKYIAFCGGIAGRSVCVNPAGEIFLCGYSAKQIAKLDTNGITLDENYFNIIAKRMAGEIKRCMGCPIEGQCIGGCYISEEFDALDKNAALSYNCNLYRRMTAELLKEF